MLPTQTKKLEELLMRALDREDPFAVKLVIQNGADVNAYGEYNKSFIHHAALLGNTDCMSVLLASGANPNTRTKELETPLHNASSPECVALLLKHGADINARDILGNTPLHMAIERNDPKCVEALLKVGADPNVLNDCNFTPFELAIHREHTACMELLISKVDVNKGDEDNYTPLHTAAARGYVKGLKRLLQVGANVNAAGHVRSESVIYRRAIFEKNEFSYERSKIPKSNSKIDNGCEKGVRPLHLCIYENHESCAKILINFGADVNVLDENGLSPLHIAATYNYVHLVHLLIDSGANVNTRNDIGETPLIMSAKNDFVGCMQILLNAGAKPEILSEYTALGYAAMEGHDECVELLLKRGANANAKQKTGETILFLAACGAHFSCVRQLILNGALL